MRTRTREVSSPISTGSKHGLMRTEPVEGTIFETDGHDANALAFVHDQVECEIFHEKVGIVSEGLAIQGVQYRVSRTVRCGSTTICLTSFAELEGLATKGSLIDFAVFRSGKGDTEAFELWRRS